MIDATKPLELWGGVECTVNRVGDKYFSQMERSDHLCRQFDLDLIADLGIRVLRYPMLWEAFAGASPEAVWAREGPRLSKLRGLGIVPIVGLLHHGSGPPDTNLVDEHFAAGLARYALRVARQFPWIEWYTPVNEPLTTARFSGLYGLWYPHGRDRPTFVRALLNEVRATVLAMQAIRHVNPRAKLLQTEDLGRCYGTPALSYQTDFENVMWPA